VLLACTGCLTTQGATRGEEANLVTKDPGASPDTGASLVQGTPSVYQLPDIRPGVRPALHTDEAGLWMQVDRIEGSLKTSGNLVRDERINAYVGGIVCKLSGPYCPDVRTYVVRIPEFNASMMPNGVMQVWTGLLLRARNEAQLATVLGHEIGHYLRRHSLQRMRDIVNAADFLVFFSMATAIAGVGPAGNLATLLAYGSIASFSRENEREADDIGLKLIAENGYDPRESAKIWHRLIRETEAAEEEKSRSIFFASHPPPEERRETLTKKAAAVIGDGPAGELGVARYRDVFGPHQQQFLKDELNLRRFGRTGEMLKMFLEDGEDVAEIKFFQGELYRLRDKDNDLNEALKSYQQALDAGSPPPEIHRSLGLVYGKLDQPKESRAAYRRYLELVPDAPDHMMIRYLIRPSS
jgi:predicted Zn-dependent protease